MTPVSELALEVIYPNAQAARVSAFVRPLNEAMERYDIVTPSRQAAFLAQAGHESGELSFVVENLNYSTPERIALIFQRFDADKNHQVSAEERDFAAQYVRKPVALANYVYANRNGNGDEASGDGWRFRARGLIGITGRGNHAACSLSLFGDAAVLVRDPERLEQPKYAALSAAWFWWSHGCNELADDEDFRKITKVINGGFNGFKQRSDLWATAKQVLV